MAAGLSEHPDDPGVPAILNVIGRDPLFFDHKAIKGLFWRVLEGFIH